MKAGWTKPCSVWKVSVKGLGPKHFGTGFSPMGAVGFFRCLWEKPIWEGMWPVLDPMNSMCLRTASMEWNVPGKYGAH